MNHRRPQRRRTHRARIRWSRVVGLIVIITGISAILAYRLPSSSSSSSSSIPSVTSHSVEVALGERGDADRPLGEADGAVPDGTTVFDDDVPGVARLDPDLLSALRRAADDAAADGVTFVVDSGWCSRDYQERLLQEAVAKYGSEEEAARWVATPDTSAHVSGDAVGIGPADAARWLSGHGAAYGLRQIYTNEPWHYELRPGVAVAGCPAMYDDPTHDPRMQ